MGENIYKDMSDKGLISKIYKQLIQLNIKKKKKTLFKWTKDMNRFYSKEDSDGQQAREKMFNTINYQRNGDQNHDEIPPHTYQNGYHKMSTNNKCW